jgi:hypothetical protein
MALAGASFTGARADTLPVTSCADDGSPGTLRSVIQAASNNDVIDMTQLACSTITLQQGQINTGNLRDLTINGPGQDALTISGGGVSPILYFYGYNSTFVLRDLTIAHGFTEPGEYARSACISALSGNVVLERVGVTDCRTYVDPLSGMHGGGAARANSLMMIDSSITDSFVHTVQHAGYARGGGALAGFVVLVRSTISGNAAIGQTGAYSGGGGLFVRDLVMVDSAITENYCAATNAGQDSPGGGVLVSGTTTIVRSSITGNSADGDGGGLFKPSYFTGSSGSSSIQNSTLAGNRAGGTGGGVAGQWPVTITGSTIAGNYSALGGAVRLGPDLNHAGPGWPDLESTIIAGNTTGPAASYAADLGSPEAVTVFGANNLIGEADATLALPSDTLRGDPQLLPLADNGGRTQTMAPAPDSPAIDAGSNLLGFVADQRGGGFVRVHGAAADIGAYEVQPPPGPGFTLPMQAARRSGDTPSVLPVTSCADDGSPGTLRAVAALAQDGDTIDLTRLTCSTITLEHGPIDTSVLGANPLRSLTIRGPGRDALTISANDASAVFLMGMPGTYRYPGTLMLSNLTIANGAKYDTAACVSGFSEYLVLDHVAISSCHTRTVAGRPSGGAVKAFKVDVTASAIRDSSLTAVDRNVASGGGVWAYQATLVGSTISGNSVVAPRHYAYQAYQTAGGGVYASGRLHVFDSTISGNRVEATEVGQDANGGGVACLWAFTISGSTIRDNTADGIGGGVLDADPRLQLPGPNALRGVDFAITNSTITGNRAALGSAFAGNYSVPIVNSTIAFNTTTLGGAVAILDTWPLEQDFYLDSTIIANNAIDGLGGHAADITASSGITVTVVGTHNLVGPVDPNVLLPSDTLRSDPLLLPLADNGGPTWTMALAFGSPALDAGANPFDLATDQRGDGYVRVSGAAADIGAYEVQLVGDVIFVDGFDP